MKPEDRPKELPGTTIRMATGCGNLYITVNLKDNKVFEIICKLGKSGGCPACQLEALSRSISIGLRAGVDVWEYYHTLSVIQCQSKTYYDGEQILSCPDAIAKVLKRYTEDAPAEIFAASQIIKDGDITISQPIGQTNPNEIINVGCHVESHEQDGC